MKNSFLIYLLLGSLLGACQSESAVSLYTSEGEGRTVEIRQFGEKFELYRHGEPFYVKGAAGRGFLAELKQAGGNTIRTWNHFGVDTLLDQAQALGLTVMVGLYLRPERHGFNYRDTLACRKQREALRKVILAYKDHPALLMWGVGNEMELRGKDDIVWQEVNRVAKMIHALDPNHPTTTMIMPLPRTATLIAKEAPEIDILSINTFGVLGTIPEKIRKPHYNWPGPYLISEWGGQGWWECYNSDWQTPLEMPYHGGKVEFYQDRYEACMKTDTTRCLGSCVFYWGHKQERTQSWFSMFLESGEKTGLVDLMQYEWTDAWPENRAPEIHHLEVAGMEQFQKLYLAPGDEYMAFVTAFDHEGDSLVYHWEILPEGEYLGKTGGDIEKRPQTIPELIAQPNQARIYFQSPEKEGPYRLFVTVKDGKGSGTVWNATFFVLENSLP